MTSNNEILTPIDPPPGPWDANDVAAYLKASRSCVYMNAEADFLPCLRIAGLLRFEPEQVRAFALGRAPAAAVVPINRQKEG